VASYHRLMQSAKKFKFKSICILKSKGFWWWCVVMCKSCFLDFVHRLYFNKKIKIYISEVGYSSVFR
jgi:hypothetical protein